MGFLFGMHCSPGISGGTFSFLPQGLRDGSQSQHALGNPGQVSNASEGYIRHSPSAYLRTETSTHVTAG